MALRVRRVVTVQLKASLNSAGSAFAGIGGPSTSFRVLVTAIRLGPVNKVNKLTLLLRSVVP